MDPEIEFVQQEIRYRRVIKTRDPEWDNLWHLNGNVTPSMNITEAWDIGYSGRGIKIAIVDDGLQTNHTDLDSNVDITLSHDYNDEDNDPTPTYGNSHGTKVAGLIAAEKDNEVCTVGIAYESTIIGVRLLGKNRIADSVEAQALIHSLSNVDIYSNSWGPADGYGFSSPGILTQYALETGISKGRGGKGVIYTWAAGNGGLSDNCNGDGYVNSIYTIGITSVRSGQNARYSEVCAAALAATYGGSSEDRYLTSTTTSSGCTDDGIQGTSFSTPIASAIIALTLQANPNLTWRDIQHLIVLTSSSSGFNVTYSNWKLNGALKEYSQVLGFGLMNAGAMVTQAKQWTTVPSQQACTTSTRTMSISTSGSKLSTDSTSVTASDCSAVVFLEHVTVNIAFTYNRYRGHTEFYLVSPSGTESHLLHYRSDDDQSGGRLTWTFMSVHFWWENPLGTWTLQFRSTDGYSTVTLDSWYLTFYGTTTDPRHKNTTATTSPSTTTTDNPSTTTTDNPSTTTTYSPSARPTYSPSTRTKSNFLSEINQKELIFMIGGAAAVGMIIVISVIAFKVLSGGAKVPSAADTTVAPRYTA